MIEAYPLCWPAGYSRNVLRKNALFKTSMDVARRGILEEIKQMKGKNVIISTNLPVRADGFPNGSYKHTIDDPAVAVYFTYENEQVVFACDKWNEVRDNMQAIRKAIEAFRGLDRWGVSDMLKRAFTGFKALPAATEAKAWYEILGVPKNASKDTVVTAYRNLAKMHHPDAGGSHNHFTEINSAYQQGLKEKSSHPV